MAERVKPPRHQSFDHVLIGTPHLDETIAQFSLVHGVNPAFGGSHPAHGTSNYLLGLGERCYAEFVGPAETNEADLLNRIVRELPGERLIGLAFQTADLDTTVQNAKDLGLTVGPTLADSRHTPEGQLLSWRAALFEQLVFPGLLFFAIEWRETSHPSLNAPMARLQELEITAPDPAARTYVDELMGSDVTVLGGPVFRMRCKIATDAGSIEYSSAGDPLFMRA